MRSMRPRGGSCAVGVDKPRISSEAFGNSGTERKRARFGARFRSAEMATGQRRIPGPAGALQEALRRGRNPDKIEAGDGAGPSGNPPPGSRTAGEAGLPGAIRPDEPYWQINLREHWAFKLGSWRRALDTIDVDQFEPTNPLLKTNCAWILEGGWKTTRCQRLCVAILNNFKSEFGDMKIVVGDPTGQIRCIVHKDVVKAESDAIRKGGSLLLKNVPIITFPECIEHMLVVTENELVQCFAPEEEPYLTKKHFETAEELAAAVSRSMGMSEEDIEAGLAARASQGTPGREEPRASQGTPKSQSRKAEEGVFEGEGAAASEARTPTPAKATTSTAGWGRANVVVDNGTDDEDSDDEDAALASQGPNSPEVVARRLHDQVLELERVQNERDEAARMRERKRKDASRSPGGQQGVETAFDDPPREPAPATEGIDGAKEEAKEEAKDGAKEEAKGEDGEDDGGVSAFALAAANLLGGKK